MPSLRERGRERERERERESESEREVLITRPITRFIEIHHCVYKGNISGGGCQREGADFTNLSNMIYFRVFFSFVYSTFISIFAYLLTY